MATKAQNLALLGGNVDASGEVDSNTVDGIDSSQFLRSDAPDSATGAISIQADGSGTALNIQSRDTDGGVGYINFVNTLNGSKYGAIGTDGSGVLVIDSYTNGTSNHRINIASDKVTFGSINVGIGTSSPSARVDIYDSRTTGTDVDLFRISSASGGGFAIGQQDMSNGNPVHHIRTYANESIAISQAYNEYVRFDGLNGRVGIGTTSPQVELHIQSSDYPYVRTTATGYTGLDIGQNSDNGEGLIKLRDSQPLSFWTADTKRAEFTSDGHFVPGATDTYDLGNTSFVWRNIYTGDLHLSNEAKSEGNEVDGTKGNWTIQEGEEHLYIINNKSGKKYRFALEEIE